jgi:HK97 gp10 family phage protein
MKIKVEGLKALDAALSELKTGAAKGVLRRVGREALQPFDKSWRAKAPHMSWDLEQSGEVGSRINRRNGHVRQSAVEVFAGPGPNPQAIQQEFGNKNHPPQPFARPAWEETKEGTLESVASGLGQEIAKSAERARRKSLKAKG